MDAAGSRTIAAVACIWMSTLGACPAVSRADDKADMQSNFGQMLGDVMLADKQCPSWAMNRELIDGFQKASGIDLNDTGSFTQPFLDAYEKSTNEANEIIKDSSIDEFCRIAGVAYGPDGARAKDLLLEK